MAASVAYSVVAVETWPMPTVDVVKAVKAVTLTNRPAHVRPLRDQESPSGPIRFRGPHQPDTH